MRKPSAVEEQDLENLSSLFRLLSDKTRLNILILLAAGERNVTNLCELLALPQPTVSHHLGLLRMNNLIGNRRNGKQVFYMLNGRIDLKQEDTLKMSVGLFDVQLSVRDRTISSLTHEAASSPAADGGAGEETATPGSEQGQ